MCFPLFFPDHCPRLCLAVFCPARVCPMKLALAPHHQLWPGLWAPAGASAAPAQVGVWNGERDQQWQRVGWGWLIPAPSLQRDPSKMANLQFLVLSSSCRAHTTSDDVHGRELSSAENSIPLFFVTRTKRKNTGLYSCMLTQNYLKKYIN